MKPGSETGTRLDWHPCGVLRKTVRVPVVVFTAYRKAKGEAELHVSQAGALLFVKGGRCRSLHASLGGVARRQQAAVEDREVMKAIPEPTHLLTSNFLAIICI